MPTASWEKDVLSTLQAPVTTGNLRLLRAWQRAEGGHTNNTATWNWLNTTKGRQFPAMNSVGVRRFPDYRTGVAYTADTIIGGYPGLMAALRTGKPYSPQYRDAVIGDFSKWVSGSRTARPDYGQKILGMRVQVQNPAPISTPRGVKKQATVRNPQSRNELGQLSSMDAMINALDDGDEFWDLLRAVPEDYPELATPASKPHPMEPAAPAVKGGGFQVPTSWTGTHVTDNLGWGTETAHDFMLDPGTPVRVPEGGKVIKHGSAQGGQSLWFRGDSGRTYWFGHIDNLVPVGRRLRAGARFGNVANQSVSAPHLHADVS